MTNQNQTQNPQRTVLPKGNYKVKCVAAKFGLASTGTEQIGMRLEITEGDHKGEQLLSYRFFTEATEERTIGEMRSLGWQGVDVTDLSSLFKGKEAIAVIDHEKDQDGNVMAKVQWINGADVQMKTAMEGAQLASFAKRMRGVAARIGGGDAKDSRSSLPPVSGRGGRSDDEPPPFDPGESRGYRR